MIRLRPLALAIASLLVALATTLVVAVTLLGVPRADAAAIARLLAIVGAAAALGALVLSHPVVLGRFGGVRAQTAGAVLLATLVLLAMVLAGARAMFISSHDLAILLTMLLFASLLGTSFSLLWASPLARRVEKLRAAAGRVATGDPNLSVEVEGHDEITALASDFNRMALALRRATEHEREIERARRDQIAAGALDLRTPLAAVRALLEAVADGVAADPETERRYLSSAQQEIVHLIRFHGRRGMVGANLVFAPSGRSQGSPLQHPAIFMVKQYEPARR